MSLRCPLMEKQIAVVREGETATLESAYVTLHTHMCPKENVGVDTAKRQYYYCWSKDGVSGDFRLFACLDSPLPPSSGLNVTLLVTRWEKDSHSQRH